MQNNAQSREQSFQGYLYQQQRSEHGYGRGNQEVALKATLRMPQRQSESQHNSLVRLQRRVASPGAGRFRAANGGTAMQGMGGASLGSPIVTRLGTVYRAQSGNRLRALTTMGPSFPGKPLGKGQLPSTAVLAQGGPYPTGLAAARKSIPLKSSGTQGQKDSARSSAWFERQKSEARFRWPVLNEQGGQHVSRQLWQQAAKKMEGAGLKAKVVFEALPSGTLPETEQKGDRKELGTRKASGFSRKAVARTDAPREEDMVAKMQASSRAAVSRQSGDVEKKQGKPFQFLSSVGGHDAITAALIKQASGRALTHRDGQAQPSRQVKIFTTLDVNKPVKLPRRDKTGGQEDHIVEDLNAPKKVLRSSREPVAFRISKGTVPARSAGRLSPIKISSNPHRGQQDYIRYQQDLGQEAAMGGINAEPASSLRAFSQQDDFMMRVTGGSPMRSTKRASHQERHQFGTHAADEEEDELNVAWEQSFGHQVHLQEGSPHSPTQIEDKLPYPELFDRTERTFAATFAKFGDLSYFTPIQRIGVYMDYSARLKKRHLTDLIAYLKTAKHPAKPRDEEHANTDEGFKEYLDHCLYLGAMPLEDAHKSDLCADAISDADVAVEEVDAVYDFPAPPLEDRGQFNYDQVWSPQLVRQVELSTHRFLKYVDSIDTIKNEEIAKFKKAWMQRALERVPQLLLRRHPDTVRSLFQEVFASYTRAMKEAVLLYILRSPEERKRLHILMLPQARVPSSARHARLGGYSIRKYQNHHQRRLEAETLIKEKLLTNNIATSALQSWWQEFQHFSLVELRGLGKFIEEAPDQQGSAVYGMEVDQFLRLQVAYQRKTVALLKHVWHRGCILMIKKFKMLRTIEQQREAVEMMPMGGPLAGGGRAARGRWTFAGYKAGKDEEPQRRWVKDEVWRSIYEFDYDKDMSPLQAYYTRSASVYQNVHLRFYENEKGLESTDILDPLDLCEDVTEKDLVDIRDSPAYHAYLALVGGGEVNYHKNGYKALSKQYRKEIKFVSGNLMELQLRAVVARSVRSLGNFFKGFLTLEELKKAVGGKPIRQIRPMRTTTRTERKRAAREKQELEARASNPALAARHARRRPTAASQREEQIADLDPSALKPMLNFPDFMDYQDFVNPVFRLDLMLQRESVSSVEDGPVAPTPEQRELEFSMKDQEILDGFSSLVDRIVASCNKFLRPEHCKIEVLSVQKFEQEWEEVRRSRLSSKSHSKPEMEERHTRSPKKNTYSASVQQDFDSLLHPDVDIGSEIYRKFMGCITTVEKMDKELAKKGDRAGPGKKDKKSEPERYHESSRYLKVADQAEPGFQEVKQQILETLVKHLHDTKRVCEVFHQFQSIIDGTMRKKVVQFVTTVHTEAPGPARDKEYSALIRELRCYLILANQLPTLIFMPMFEVGVIKVKEELLERIKNLLEEVFETYEEDVIVASHGLCQQYDAICKRLSQALQTPEDVAEMDRFKNQLLLDMARLQADMKANQQAVFFLFRADRPLKPETQELVLKLHRWPQQLDEHLDKCDEKHIEERAKLEKEVALLRRRFDEDTVALRKQIEDELAPMSKEWTAQMARTRVERANDLKNSIKEARARSDAILEKEKMIFGYVGDSSKFEAVAAWFMPYHDLQVGAYDVQKKKEGWRDCALPEIDPDEVDQVVKEHSQALHRLERELAGSAAASKALDAMRKDIAWLKDEQPIIEVVCNPALRSHHWEEIKVIMNANINPGSLNLEGLKQVNVQEYLAQLTEVSERAKREARLDRMLRKMEKEWEGQVLELSSYRDTGIQVLQGANVEEVQVRLDEHRLLSQTIRSSADIGHLQQKAVDWEKRLAQVQEALETWVRVQANFLYLAPVMQSEDIRSTLPREAKDFSEVTEVWSEITARLSTKPPVLDITQGNNILDQLIKADASLEKVVKRLSLYLETKRECFPRFFFLSNEELLEILGESKKPERVQPHMKKCFEGIQRVDFEQRAAGLVITNLISPEGEVVELLQEVDPAAFKNNVEQWLGALESQMQLSIQENVHNCIVSLHEASQDPQKRKEWRLSWLGQAILAASQQAWTNNIKEALLSEDTPKALRACLEQDEEDLAEIVGLVREQLTPLARSTLGCLITLNVHARDVLKEIQRNETSNHTDFDWLCRLRYNFDPEMKQLEVCMVMTSIEYAHEYLGNTTRLVVTPLTDKCYMTLMTAMELNLGGAPEGPAGTGKTETTKDLAKAVAVHCLVFNCADGLDVLSMAKFFKGLASAGSWSCFDEFNRIDVEVLSVIAQQILEIQTAKSQRKDQFLFEETWITLRQRCNLFITMNPGYAGRAELPDNLKALFRPVAMMIPDYAMIGEISLYSFGFLQSRELAEKIVASFRLCSEQLSSQAHYDYGMRAVKAVLNAAKALKQAEPATAEPELILRSITSVNLPKFLAQDIPQFYSVLQGLFPGADTKSPQDEKLRGAACRAARKAGLQDTEPFIEKVLQFGDTIRGRHGVMLVGPPAAAKTTTYKVLASAFSEKNPEADVSDQESVETFLINPRSLTMSELYGAFDKISHEFSDGVLGRLFRDCTIAENPPAHQWIIFDGPVEADWIENLNTVLDDNKKLCLLNGEVIQMTSSMRFIFETDDLSNASPATVSRAGMVYLEPAMLGARTHFESWLQALVPHLVGPEGEEIDPRVPERISALFDALFHQCVTFVLEECRPIVKCTEVQLAHSLLSILQSRLKEQEFLAECHDPRSRIDDLIQRVDMRFQFAMAWSLGTMADENGQKSFSAFMRKVARAVHRRGEKAFRIEANCVIPEQGGQNVSEFFIDVVRWLSWRERLPRAPGPQYVPPPLNPAQQIIIPTTEVLKLNSMLSISAQHGLPLLIIGPTGTGKSSTIKKFLKEAQDKRTSIQMVYSAKSTAKQTGEMLLAYLERRGRRVMGPPPGKKCTIFIDDLNMPAPGKYGAQPPNELLRQLIDHHQWYDQTEKGRPLRETADVDYLAAMSPPGGGRHTVSARLLRHFNVISLGNFSEEVLLRIFQSQMEDHLRRHQISGAAGVALRQAVTGTVQVLLFAQRELKPTPSKSHYIFSMREADRAVQGLMRIRKEHLRDEDKKVCRLWMHEVARVFSDRLATDQDKDALFQQVCLTMRDKLKDDVAQAAAGSLAGKAPGPELLEEGILFADCMAGRSYYDEVTAGQREALHASLQRMLEEHNAHAKVPISIVLFEQAMLHLLRIGRILKMPTKGHVLMVGLQGTGRQSLSKLATALCDHDIVEIEFGPGSAYEQWREGLKSVLVRTGQEGRSCVLLLPDARLSAGSFMLGDLNNLLNSDTVPNLFPADDWMQIEERLRAVAKRSGLEALHDSGTREELEEFFIQRSRLNLHVIVTMSPVGNALRERIRDFPALVSCCSIDWLTRWPDNALEAVCEQILSDVELPPGQMVKVQQACRRIYGGAIALADQFLEAQGRHVYVTPSNYLALLKTYRMILDTERERTSQLKEGYEGGVEKLLSSAGAVQKLRQALSEKQPRLEQMSEEADLLMAQIEKESVEVVEPKKAVMQKEENAANLIAQEAEAIRNECQADLDAALPVLKKAQEALHTIKRQHVEEVTSLLKPPSTIKKVLHAVCIMLQRKAERTPKKDRPQEYEENWWAASQKLMRERNFLEQLLQYDKDHIPEAVMKKIREQFVTDPEFKPSRAEKASYAAKGLCQWVLALDQYDRVLKVVSPKKAKAAEAEYRYQTTLAGLQSKQAELAGIIAQFEALQARLEETKRHRQQLVDDIEDCTRKLGRAKTLLEGLGGEQGRWKEAALALGASQESLVGDCLLAAATIAFLGPYTGDYRSSQSAVWAAIVKELGIAVADSVSLQALLGEPVVIRQWALQGLPTDPFSVDNAIIATRARSWPLMIDPQGQASKWIRNLEGSRAEAKSGPAGQQGLVCIRPGDADFVRKFEHAIPLGLPVLLEGVGLELPPVLVPLLEKRVTTAAGSLALEFGDSVLDYSAEFRFYIATKLPNPHFLPEVSTKVAVVNFSITCSGLRDQLLDLIIQRENSQLDEEQRSLIQTTYENKLMQRDVEARILEVLRSSEGNILEDEEAIDVLAQSQQLANEIKAKQETANVTQAKLDEARREYAPSADHGSLLYFIVQKLQKIDVMYQYSLSWFLQLYLNSLDSFRMDYKAAEEAEVPAAEEGQEVEEGPVPEEPPKVETATDYNTETIGTEHLREHFTYSLFQNVSRSLFEKDKLLFSLLLAAKLAQAAGRVSKADYRLVIQGADAVATGQRGVANPARQWLPDQRWQHFASLAPRSPVIQSFVESFQAHDALWRRLVQSESPLSEELPPASADGQDLAVSSFAKLLIIKCLNPSKFLPAARQVVAMELGDRYLSPPLFDIERSFEDSSPTVPLIFVLPGADPLGALTSFARRKKRLESLKSVSLGQGQDKRAEQAIADARKAGSWVFLQNCHLYPSWMPRLEQIFEQLTARASGTGSDSTGEYTHTSFRLWLSSYPSSTFPSLVLRNGIKMTNEPPRGLKASMIRGFSSSKGVQEPLGLLLARAGPAQRLIYSLCMLHAVLEGRKRFGTLGWNVSYSFSISDLSITFQQLLFYMQHSESGLSAISAVRTLAELCNYGGRVTDERDRRVLAALLEEFCSPEAIDASASAAAAETSEFGLPAGVTLYRDVLYHIQELPVEQPPELFGFQASANVAKNRREMRQMCQELNRLGEVEGLFSEPIQLAAEGKAGETPATQSGEQGQYAVMSQCEEILRQIPAQPFDMRFIWQVFPISSAEPYNSVLVQEVQRYQPLIDVITSSIHSVLQTIKGEEVASQETEKLSEALLVGEVPELWARRSYPTERSLIGFIVDLRHRIAALEAWVARGSAPQVFWLPGFFFPQSFLTATLQEHATRYSIAVNTLTHAFEYTEAIIDEAEEGLEDRSDLPENGEGAYMSGLYLEGASWSVKDRCLVDQAAEEAAFKMPVLLLRPVVIGPEGANQFSLSSTTFDCPVYRSPARRGVLSTTGHSTNFVIYVALPCGGCTTASTWTKRGAALLCEPPA